MDLRRSIASSLRAAGLTGAGAEVPMVKETPTLLGEQAQATGWGATGRAVLVRGVADKDGAGVVPSGSATGRETPTEEESESDVVVAPVSPVVLPSPSIPLVPTALLVPDSWAAASPLAGALPLSPDDANAHIDRGGERRRVGETETEEMVITHTSISYTNNT
ncbi:hypothetical protein NDU88_003500 [Pleurodeles waltl]|uniref:Uncharacterized protein n=1 Tax=Pleurodeles waltl TaxID=8319 RepID=A0AAV7VHL1_PLEWA|nr:hypothetical protein NDU88_003500 [Pleurodeles waltl]